MISSWETSADTSLREKLWAGSVPIKIDLAMTDVSALELPKPMYILANRLTYLATLLKDIKKHFESSAPSPCDPNGMWLEYNNTPLGWNIPVGVLFDLLQADLQIVPWPLTLHYRGLHEEQIVRCSGIDSIRFFYINALKEAMYLRTNSSKEIMNMAKEEENKLVESIFTMDFTAFWSINSKLIDVAKEDIKKASIRVYQNTLDNYIQLPGNILDDKGKNITIGEYLHTYICPQLLDKVVVDGGVVVEKAKGKSIKILIHGIECALDTPLHWMLLNMAYIDNFIYIVILTEGK